MSSRFADPTAMRTRSPIYHDDSPKRPPPSPPNKTPPPKRLDAKSRTLSEEPYSAPSKAPPVGLPESPTNSCMDKSSNSQVVVDLTVFEQVLELDEGDDDHEFSQSMVHDYLQQAEASVELMDGYFAKQELTQLSKEGHFLKGSSAALGVVQVQEICEKIQHLGNRIDKDSGVKLSEDDALARIKPLLARLKDERATAAKCLEKLCGGDL